MSNAVSGTRSRKQHKRKSSGSSVLSALLVTAVVIGGAYYLLQLVLTGDPLWFRTDFNAQPRHLVIQDRGQRIDVPPTDTRFDPLVDAFNRTIERGYYDASMGFSDPTWQVVEQNGLIVETTYAEPVRLHGLFVPTTRMRILISGEQVHTTQLLFRSNETEWDRGPLRLNDVSLLDQAVKGYGFGQ